MSDLHDERMRCACCDAELAFRWSDTHGVGVCINCGLPYVIYHYENDQRVNKPPRVAVNEEGVELARRYWDSHKRRVFPACYDMGILGNRGSSYSGATVDDCKVFGEWYDVQPEVVAAKALQRPQRGEGE